MDRPDERKDNRTCFTILASGANLLLNIVPGDPYVTDPAEYPTFLSSKCHNSYLSLSLVDIRRDNVYFRSGRGVNSRPIMARPLRAIKLKD